MNFLFWDPALAKVAQDYSEKCSWGHNGNRKTDLVNSKGDATFKWADGSTPGVGENIYASTASETLEVLLKGIDLFYEEYEYYTFSDQSCKSGEQCGEF